MCNLGHKVNCPLLRIMISWCLRQDENDAMNDKNNGIPGLKVFGILNRSKFSPDQYAQDRYRKREWGLPSSLKNGAIGLHHDG